MVHILKLLADINWWANHKTKSKCAGIFSSTINGILRSTEYKSTEIFNDMIKACSIFECFNKAIEIQDLKEKRKFSFIHYSS